MTLAEFIYKTNNTFVPNPSWVKESGSLIHKISRTQAIRVANEILIVSKAFPLATVEILNAWAEGESMYDQYAINPNNQEEAKKPDQFSRTDYGFAQVDGLYMASHPGMQGLSQSEMVALAYNLQWAAHDLGNTATELLTWAHSLSDEQCGSYASNKNIVGFNAYNSGREGALDMLAKNEPLAYGERLNARIVKNKTLVAF